jgi:hypothetical protein
VFSGALLVAVICAFVSIWAGAVVMRIALACFGVALLCSLVDSMQTRTAFNQQIYEMQEAHYKKYLESGKENTNDIPLAFSREEYSYIKKQRRGFVYAIILKTVLVIALLASLFT